MSEWAVNPVNPLIMQIRVHRFREQICLINAAGMGLEPVSLYNQIKNRLISIAVLHFSEIYAIKDIFERNELMRLLEYYGESFNPDQSSKKILKTRTEELISKQFGVADAAHVAFSEYYGSVFITCDDKLLVLCGKNNISVDCQNPVIFSEKENLK